jgi:hypothetical protein
LFRGNLDEVAEESVEAREPADEVEESESDRPLFAGFGVEVSISMILDDSCCSRLLCVV